MGSITRAHTYTYTHTHTHTHVRTYIHTHTHTHTNTHIPAYRWWCHTRMRRTRKRAAKGRTLRERRGIGSGRSKRR
jgi:hypothetical protein